MDVCYFECKIFRMNIEWKAIACDEGCSAMRIFFTRGELNVLMEGSFVQTKRSYTKALWRKTSYFFLGNYHR